MSMDDTRAWLTLLRAPAFGATRLREALEQHGSAEAVLAALLARSEPLVEATRAWLRSPDPERLDADLEWLAGRGHSLLTCVDPDFPTLLQRTPAAPAALFVAGDPTALWRPQVAIVGSRNPTAAGRENAAAFAAALADAGLTITSGLAEGVDAAAHAAALATPAGTIAVVGTGPDRVYPARHRALAAQVVGNGALVTEFPPGTGAKREHFPRRNRVIAGLSLGTLVIEAGVQSGALITARLAGEAGREVFALPGSIHNPLARGCHRLIRQGATLVETTGEVLEAIAPVARQLADALRSRLQLDGDAVARTPPDGPDAPADPDHARLWEALGHEPAGLDQLAARTGLTVHVLSSMLLSMELEGRVSAAHGRYARVVRG
jgi:DNA processing protein